MEFQLTRAIEVLERTPAALRALLHGLSDEWTMPDEGPQTFSAYDNVGHLVHGERADWIPRARLILAQGPDRRFAPVDRMAHQRESAGKPLAELLDDFARLRAENLAILRSWELDERALALEGEHPALGRVTLRELLGTWVAHDLGHLAQIARVLAKQYREAVGPWRAFLPVLTRPARVEETKAVAERLPVEFFSRVWAPPHELDAIDELMTEDYVITSGGTAIQGRDAFKEWVRAFQTTLLDATTETLEVIANADGDRVVSRWVCRGRNNGIFGLPADGRPLSFTGIAIWRVRDGRLAECWVERAAWEAQQELAR